MLPKHSCLYYPIPVPSVLKDIDFPKYIKIHENQTQPTDPSLVEEIKYRFYKANSYAEKKNLDELWEFIGPKIKDNAGLAEFTKAHNGPESMFFIPWLRNIFLSPATALEMAYGAGPDVNGEWRENIHKTQDPIAWFILHDPAFVYHCERQFYVANLAMTIDDRCRAGNEAYKIVDFGAGRMAWLRRHGCKLGKNVEIYAFDKDKSIKLEEIVSQIGESPTIHYSHEDFVGQLSNPELAGADLIILGGVASYVPPEVFYGKLIPAIWMLLKSGGEAFFDLQLKTPCYEHSIDILGWEKFALPDNSKVVEDSVRQALNILTKRGVIFDAEFIEDSRNNIPSAVMVTLTKTLSH